MMTAVPATPPDDPDKLANFEAIVASGERIEAGEWMPQQYRAECLRLIQMHANSELMGALPEREWIPRAPTLRRKMALVAKVQDEVGHAQLLYRVAEDLGKPRPQMIEERSEEHTSELQSHHDLVCRLLLE